MGLCFPRNSIVLMDSTNDSGFSGTDFTSRLTPGTPFEKKFFIVMESTNSSGFEIRRNPWELQSPKGYSVRPKVYAFRTMWDSGLHDTLYLLGTLSY